MTEKIEIGLRRNSETPISVIVPVFNAQETLQKCLPGLAASATEWTEIIIVDNGSSDKSFAICEDFKRSHNNLKVLLLREETQGPSAARNGGAKFATGKWLLFTDADCIPSPTWISDYLVHFSEAELGAVAGCIQPYPPSNAVQKAIALFTLPPITKGISHRGSNLREGFYPTANLAVKKEIFHSVGGFNENLRYGEDHELCHKIYQAGYRIKAVENAAVEHIHRTSLKGLLKQAFGFGSSHPFELKYFTPGRTILTAPFLDVNRETPGRWIWIDLNQADKKLLLSLIPALFWLPLCFLPIFYLFYLCFFIRKIGAQRNVTTKIRELPLLSLLLLIKSVALGAGRFVYSFKHKALCV